MRFLRIPAILVGFSLCLACSGEDNFEFSFVVVKAPIGGTCANTASSNTALQANKYNLRLTFMQRDKGAIAAHMLRRKYTLICDRVLKPGEASDLQISVAAGAKFALTVEAFNTSTKQLEYVGQTETVDLGAERATVYLRPVSKVTCADAAAHPRAFHTATLLPNGRVLVMGGMVSDATLGKKLHDDTQDAWATGTVEVYDPATMSFLQVKGSIPARAFHQAHLLPSPIAGPYEVLVVGGVKSAANPPGPAFRLRAKAYSYPFLVSPHEKSAAATALLVTYIPAKTPGAKPEVKFKYLSGLPKLMHPASAVDATRGQALFTGGGQSYLAAGQDKGFQRGTSFWIELKSRGARGGKEPKVTAKFQLQRPRVGHGVVPMGPSRYYIFGGTMDGKENCKSPKDEGQDCNKDGSEFLNVTTAGSSSSLLTGITPMPEVVAWHTLTTIGLRDDQIAPEAPKTPTIPTAALLAGGFTLKYDSTHQRLAWDQTAAAYGLQLVRDGSPPTLQAVTAGSGGFTWVGYHSALRLANGDVMLSGGNVNSSWFPKAPCEKVSSAFCAQQQIAIYRLKGGIVELAQATQMALPRFGHRSTRLLDNTVLITGGVTLVGSKAELVQQAEVFNPRSGNFSEDPFGRAPAQDYDTTKKSSGHKCLLQD